MATRTDLPPGSSRVLVHAAKRALAPLERFFAVEAAGGIVLLVAAAVALCWANSPWSERYFALWETPLSLHVGSLLLEHDLRFVVNDGLMTVFFLLAGLEIRRELHRGELSTLRRAALPAVAAAGGMVVPACIFLALNAGGPGAAGWGIPMATDIAFAAGVFALLGERVPRALRVQLLALAVIDDVGAFLVIAIFYSSHLAPVGFVVAAAGIGIILVMQWAGVRPPWAYVAPGVVVWAGALAAGMHPALSGVVVGLLTPTRAWLGLEGFLEEARATLGALRGGGDSATVQRRLDRVATARREAVSPLDNVEHSLVRWVAYGIMPLFALANAGVRITAGTLEGEPMLIVGVVAGLVVGKPLGVVAFSWLAARARLVTLPDAVTWPRLALVGVVAGIGFTMSIFIAELAFVDEEHVASAKLAVLIASGAAALLAVFFGRRLRPLPATLPSA